MALPKFPRPEVLIEAVTRYTSGIVTDEQIQALKRAWPQESTLADLGNLELQQNELWDKAEAYMVKIVQPGSLIHRLKVWCFKVDWIDDKAFLQTSIEQMGKLFDFMENN